MNTKELINRINKVYEELPQNSKLAAFVFHKAINLENFDLFSTIAVLEQNGESENILSLQTLKRLNLHLQPNAKTYYIPPKSSIPMLSRENKIIPISQATKEEKIDIAKGNISTKEKAHYCWSVGYDIKDTDCPKDCYSKYKNYHFNDVSHTDIYINLSSFAESIGITVNEDNISSLCLDGFYNDKTDEIVVNSNLNVSNKVKTLCESLAKGIIVQTSTQPKDVKIFEEQLLSKSLQNLCQLPITFEDMNFNIANLNGCYCRSSKATSFVANGIINQMDISRQNEINHTKNQSIGTEVEADEVAANFLQGLR
ncbi:MAG: hypothetical protein RSC41_03370 [Oscillospiraceae bacterium]